MPRQTQRIVAPARRDRSRKPRVESLERRDLMALYTVSTVADSGPGSLREAIVMSNANADLGANSIDFAITAGTDRTIALLSPLPAITHSVAIDGQTEPGYSGAPVVVLNGSGAGAAADGLTLMAGGNVVRGLTINGFAGGRGIVLAGDGNDTVQNCNIGTGADGSTAVTNRVGVAIGSINNVVGGDQSSQINIISGNTVAGITVAGAATGNLIEGNYIGLASGGLATLPNGDGISFGPLTGGAIGAGNKIGGTVFGSGNFISGNARDGIALNGSTGSTILGNYIGLNANGDPAGNGGNGVSVVVSGGSTAPLALPNTIGGTVDGEGNLIWFNAKAGVLVANTSGGAISGVSIRGNAIKGNGALGIDIGGDGVTPGTLFVTAATRDLGNVLTVSGVYHGAPSTTYRVDLYANTAADPSGYGQGELFLSAISVTTDILGNATFSQPYNGVAQTVFAATVTDGAGSTSEFSLDYPLIASAPKADLALALAGPSGTVFAGSDVTLTATITNNGTGTATGVAFDDLLPAGLSFVSGSSPSGAVTTDGSGALHAAIGPIAPGARVTITIRANASQTGALTNAAAAFGATFDPNYANNQATQTITILPAVRPTADLGIAQTSFAPFVGKVVGQHLVYTLTVMNNGPSNATGVVVTDFIPAGQIYVDASSSQGTSSYSNGLLTTTLGSLQVGASATVTILLTLAQAGPATNVANVMGGQLDTSTANNSSSLVDTITGSAATTPLTLTQVASPASGAAGQAQTITITVTNPNTSAATGVLVTDTLPANARFVSASTGAGTYSVANGTLTASLGTLAAGASAMVVLNLVPTGSGSIVNNAATIASGVAGAPVTFSTQTIPVAGVGAGPTVTGVAGPGSGANLPRLAITFSTPLNAASALRKANYRLTALGTSGTGSKSVAVKSVSYNATTRTATLVLATALARAQSFRLVVVGAQSTGIKDLAGNRLNGSGVAGSNYVTTFLGTSLARS